MTHDFEAIKSGLAHYPVALTSVCARSSDFLKLGLLHPLGGGQQPLDAMVIVDHNMLRRLVLPFGWGAGKHVEDLVTGPAVRQRFAGMILDGLFQLSKED